MAQKVNVWDQAEVKNTLDDAIVRFMIEEQKRSEDNLLSDLKLLLGVVSCVLATYAYLYPLKYPDNRTVLLVCCGSYWIISFVMQFISSYLEGTRVIRTKPSDKHANSVEIRTDMPAYSERYSFEVTVIERSSSKRHTVEITKPVTEWFSADGSFFELAFVTELKRALERLENSAKKRN